MSEENQKITPSKIEKSIDNTAFQCAPLGEFINKDTKQLIKYPNRFKVGNGFKTIADFRSIEQIEAFIKAYQNPKIHAWLNKNLPKSTSDTDSEVEDESS